MRFQPCMFATSRDYRRLAPGRQGRCNAPKEAHVLSTAQAAYKGMVITRAERYCSGRIH
jgi:hypothetical protein